MLEKILPKEITSYDLVKTFAVLFMIIDHIGVYFFPEDFWWRVAGRMCVPVWFFLIGYARSRDVSSRIWMGAFILMGVDVIVGWPIFPSNILFTILWMRLILDYVAKWFETFGISRFVAVIGMVVMLIPTAFLSDYGTSGLVLVLYGYFVRRYQDGACSQSFMRGNMVFAFIFFFFSQQVFFGFDPLQFGMLGGGLLFVVTALQYFRAHNFVGLKERIGVAGSAVLKICGRYSLEIFVVHLLVFKVVALACEREGMGLLAFKLIVQ
ncbi:MAG: hypothetical protein KAJ40_04130 [Alphaproteobacteria bacterium]|nr:hypothetical protein [Alphaproteobacteria bacterium]